MIRRAQIKDISGINKMLYQVCNVHAAIRPDIFIRDCKKYNDEELAEIIKDDNTPIYVCVDDEDTVLGYCFCIYKIQEKNENMQYRKELYIDDLCVDETLRGQHVGRQLFEHVRRIAEENECTALTLNVWEGNDSARAFYERRGLKPLKTTMEMNLHKK